MAAKKSTLFGCGALIFALLVNGLFFNGSLGNQQGLMIEPITSDLGIARTTYSTLMMGGSISVTLLSAFFPQVHQKLGLKRMVCLGSLGAVGYCGFNLLAGAMPSMAVGFILLAQISVGFAFGWAGLTTATILINNWFAKRRGLIISIASASAGVGGIIAAPLINSWILNHGWEFSMQIRGIVAVAVFFLLLFLIKETPGPKDSVIWENEGDSDIVAEETVQEQSVGLTFEEARKTRNFWFAVLGTFGFGMFIYPAFVSLAAYVSDIGYPEQSGFAMSVVYFASILITFPLGSLMEKFGCRTVLSIMLLLMMGGMAILSMTSISVPMVYVAAACVGVGYSTFQVPHPLLAMEIGGPKSYVQIQSYLYSAMNAGMIISVPIFNIFFDLLGSYRPVFMADIVLVALNILFIFVATGKVRKPNVGKMQDNFTQ